MSWIMLTRKVQSRRMEAEANFKIFHFQKSWFFSQCPPLLSTHERGGWVQNDKSNANVRVKSIKTPHTPLTIATVPHHSSKLSLCSARWREHVTGERMSIISSQHGEIFRSRWLIIIVHNMACDNIHPCSLLTLLIHPPIHPIVTELGAD